MDASGLSKGLDVGVAVMQGSVMVTFGHAKERGGLQAAAFHEAVEECLRLKDHLSLVFLWVHCVDACCGRRDGLTGAGVPVLSIGSEISATRLEAIREAISRLPQPVIGLASGELCAASTSILAACDHIVAARGATFQRIDSDNQAWTMLERRRQRGRLLEESQRPNERVSSMTAERAHAIRFAGCIVDNSREAMLVKCEELRGQLSTNIPGLRACLKHRIREQGLDVIRTTPHDQAANGNGNAATAPSASSVPLPRDLPFPDLQILGSGYSGCPVQEEGFATAAEKLEAEVCFARLEGEAGEGVSQWAQLAPQTIPSQTLPMTTLMIHDIPCRVTQEQLHTVLNQDFAEKFDFVYLPMSVFGTTSVGNLGYGFVNFVDPEDALLFQQQFDGYQFEGTSSRKLCKVKPAHIQGLANNMLQFGRYSRKPSRNTLQPITPYGPSGKIDCADVALRLPI